MTAAEARFELERRLIEARVPTAKYRFFPYPDAERRLVIAWAELPDGTDIQVLYRSAHPVQIDGDNYDETQLAVEFFTMPSMGIH